MGIDKILLEGGSIINGYFLNADCVDELWLVQDIVVASKNNKHLFNDSGIKGFKLKSMEQIDGVPVVTYKK